MSGSLAVLRRRVMLHPGLIVLRLTSDSAETARFQPDIPDESADAITLIGNPLTARTWLQGAGDCLVVRCTHDAELTLVVTPHAPGAAIEGHLMIDYLTRTTPKPDTVATRRAAPAIERPDKTAWVMAHVARRGNLWGASGAWIGGDHTTGAIEGLLVWRDPAQFPDLSLRDARTGQIVTSGAFLGSRGKHQPLGGLDIWLSDPTHPKELRVEAMYQHAGYLPQQGRMICLMGADPRDPLVGLKLSLVDANESLPPPRTGPRIKIGRA